MSSYEAMSDDWYWTYCENVSFRIDEYMNYDVFDDGYLITDRDDFEERLICKFGDLPECENMSDEEFDHYVDQKLKEYDPIGRKQYLYVPIINSAHFSKNLLTFDILYDIMILPKYNRRS